MIDSTKAIIAAFDFQIADVERAIREHIDGHPKLKAKRDLLVTITGVGNTTSDTILAEMPNIEKFESARAVAAFAGLSPRTFESGSSVHGKSRICKTGNSRLRKRLYLPAVVAKTHNRLLRAFAQRLLTAGKPPLVVICAVMRKLLVLAYGVLKSGQPSELISRVSGLDNQDGISLFAPCHKLFGQLFVVPRSRIYGYGCLITPRSAKNPSRSYVASFPLT